MLHVCVYLRRETLKGAQRDVLFNLVDGDVQPTMGVCHAVAWKAAESFTLHLPAPFQTFFFPPFGMMLVCVYLSMEFQ